MELQFFLKTYVKDFDSKKQTALTEAMSAIRENGGMIVPFIELMAATRFSESLQNFADKICEEQRIICANRAGVVYKNVLDDLLPFVDRESILNANQPKIEDL